MAAISTNKLTPQLKRFHNEEINVYPTTLALDKIDFWKENNRTIFTFERLEKIKKKKIKDLTLEEITQFVSEQDIHKLKTLAESIRRNGVQVPLIIRDDGLLLDGNRRYFACQWLRIQAINRKRDIPDVLSQIPVWVIRRADLTEMLELKILAEANFIPDLKVAWPLDAQARAVDDYYNKVKKSKKLEHSAAIAEVVAVFGIEPQRAVDLLETLDLTKKFIKAGKSAEEELQRRQIVEDKFVYLWEFRNKAMRGRGALSDEKLPEVEDIFFQFMAKGKDNPITTLKQIEPMVMAHRDPRAWKMLVDSKGSKLTTVVSIVNEKKEIRKAEDKIRLFHDWLTDQDSLSPAAKSGLKALAVLATQKAKN